MPEKRLAEPDDAPPAKIPRCDDPLASPVPASNPPASNPPASKPPPSNPAPSLVPSSQEANTPDTSSTTPETAASPAASPDAPPDGAAPPKLTKKQLAKLQAEANRQARAEAKRRKEEERERERQRKEEERQRAAAERAAKKQREEEERAERRRLQEEKKRAADAEKAERRREWEEKKRGWEEKKRAAEERKRAADDERRRKEASQKLIHLFFTKPAKPAKPAPDVQKQPQAALADGYSRFFLPFFELLHMVVAPAPAPAPGGAVAVEEVLRGGTSASPPMAAFFAHRAQPPPAPADPVEVAAAMNEASAATVAAMVARLPLKFLSFYENRRPPYAGTWCLAAHQHRPPGARPLAELAGVDYEYDSDLEWREEGSDGEDIDTDGDDDDDDAGGDGDDDGFIEDDRRGPASIRQLVVATHWREDDPVFFRDYRVEALVEGLPIDPFFGARTGQVGAGGAQGGANVAGAGAGANGGAGAGAGANGGAGTGANGGAGGRAGAGTLGQPNMLQTKKKMVENRYMVARIIRLITAQPGSGTLNGIVDLTFNELKLLNVVKRLVLKDTIKDLIVAKTWDVDPAKRAQYAAELAKIEAMSPDDVVAASTS